MDLQRIHLWSPSLFLAFATVYEELGDQLELERWRTRAANAERVLGDVDAEQDSVDIETELTAVPVDEAPVDDAPADEAPAEVVVDDAPVTEKPSEQDPA
jgi:hypothetical protein